MAIYCCMGCVAPKRYPGCHGRCPEYLADKAKHDSLKVAHDRERDISAAIYADRSAKVYKAMKNHQRG